MGTKKKKNKNKNKNKSNNKSNNNNHSSGRRNKLKQIAAENFDKVNNFHYKTSLLIKCLN